MSPHISMAVMRSCFLTGRLDVALNYYTRVGRAGQAVVDWLGVSSRTFIP